MTDCADGYAPAAGEIAGVAAVAGVPPPSTGAAFVLVEVLAAHPVNSRAGAAQMESIRRVEKAVFIDPAQGVSPSARVHAKASKCLIERGFDKNAHTPTQSLEVRIRFSQDCYEQISTQIVSNCDLKAPK